MNKELKEALAKTANEFGFKGSMSITDDDDFNFPLDDPEKTLEQARIAGKEYEINILSRAIRISSTRHKEYCECKENVVKKLIAEIESLEKEFRETIRATQVASKNAQLASDEKATLAEKLHAIAEIVELVANKKPKKDVLLVSIEKIRRVINSKE